MKNINSSTFSTDLYDSYTSLAMESNLRMKLLRSSSLTGFQNGGITPRNVPQHFWNMYQSGDRQSFYVYLGD